MLGLYCPVYSEPPCTLYIRMKYFGFIDVLRTVYVSLFQITISLIIGLCTALPVPDSPSYGGNPFFSVKITQGHQGGSQTGFGTTISKQKVNVVKSTLEGQTVEEEPFVDHQPPFLALPPVKPYEPLSLPSAPPRYSNKKKQ